MQATVMVVAVGEMFICAKLGPKIEWSVLTGQALQKLKTYKCVMQNFVHLSKTKIQPKCNSFFTCGVSIEKEIVLKIF